jgi:non-heme chloroperoxidase
MQRRDWIASAAVAMGGATFKTEAGAPSSSLRGPSDSVRATDGAELHRVEWGRGAPVLFVHSWALSSVMWSYQIHALGERGRRCIAYDRRGHGRSSVPPSGYDLDTLADDLAAVIESCGADRMALVGHSMGCNEILRYAARHGTAKIDKVVLLAPTTPFILKTPDNAYGAPAEYFAAQQADWAKDFPSWVEQNKRPFFNAATSRPLMDWLVSEMLRTPVHVAIASNQAVVKADQRPDLAKMDRPVLVLHGDKDASAPLEVTGRRTAAGISGALLKVYVGAPHGLFLTHQDEVGEDIDAFLRS